MRIEQLPAMTLGHELGRRWRDRDLPAEPERIGQGFDVTEATGAVSSPLDTLLAEAPLVSICTDLNDTSRYKMIVGRLALMRPDAMLVCCARGGIVDEAARADALHGGRLCAAATGVFEREPIAPDNPLWVRRTAC